MPISNPCRWFSGGGDYSNIKEFKYEGGTTMWHFSPHDNGLSSTMECNVIFFANTEAHALDVLKRMLKFRIACAMKKRKAANSDEFSDRDRNAVENAKKYLAAIEAGEVMLEHVPTNQFFKVGWAVNDNILD